MTTSTAESKPKKAKGPIRTEAVIPSLILLALIYAYFYFFFDGHLRRGMEYAATQVHGAEVNIGHLRTSFWRASFEMGGLEVTDKEQPARNLFSVGEMRFKLVWDALLRMKAVVDEASILNIQAYTKRARPGRVLPPPPPSESLIGKVQAQVVEQTKAKFNDNFLGDIASVVGGVDPKEQLKNIQAELKSVVRAEGLEKELTAKKAEWEKRIKELPKPKEIKEYEARIKALNLKTKNPLELAGNLKKAKEILDEAKAKAKLVEQSQKDLTSDVTNYTQAIAGLQKMAEQDVADLQKRLQLPSLDPKEFSTQLFMSQVESKLVSLRKYIAVARKYMPPKKTAEQKKQEAAEALVPPKRGQGVNVPFPITTGYPLFWLKKAAVSSELTQSEWAGKVSGEITNATTEPAVVGKPLQVHLKGDFPKQQIAGLDVLATVDHTTEKAKESLRVAVAAFPVGEQKFSDTDKVKFGITSAVGGGLLTAVLADEALNVGIKSEFRKPAFQLEAKQKQLQEILGAVLAGIQLVSMEANVTGSWDKFSVDVDSNLGRELSAGFQKQMQAKIAVAKAKLDAFVAEKVNPAKKKVEEQLAALTGGPGKLLGQQKSEMDGAIKGAEGSAQGSGSGGGAKGLLKGFGF